MRVKINKYACYIIICIWYIDNISTNKLIIYLTNFCPEKILKNNIILTNFFQPITFQTFLFSSIYYRLSSQADY